MVILKRVSGATLMETLIATVLIVIVFMLTSMTLNQVFFNTIKQDTNIVDVYFDELNYKYKNGLITLPFNSEYENWQVSVSTEVTLNNRKIVFRAINNKSKRKRIQKYDSFE